MTYDEYLGTTVPVIGPRTDDPHGFCSHCGTLCHFVEDAYTGLRTSTCCGAAPAKPTLVP